MGNRFKVAIREISSGSFVSLFDTEYVVLYFYHKVVSFPSCVWSTSYYISILSLYLIHSACFFLAGALDVSERRGGGWTDRR